MCGIIGYTGKSDAVPVLLNGLKTLEYRGYDSAGIAISRDGKIKTVKSKGRLDVLSAKIGESREELYSNCGIGHTRWATHGEPSDVNSHPHSTANLALVHNGIIENYAEIEDMLREAGYEFVSQTDTEAAAKLIDLYYRRTKNPLAAIYAANAKINGSYAFGIVFSDIPDKIYACRKDSPLLAAKGKDKRNGAADNDETCSLIASDMTALLEYTDTFYRLEEGIIAVLDTNGVKFFDRYENEVFLTPETVDYSVSQAQKGGFAHFMQKEINDEPEALEKTYSHYTQNSLPSFGNVLRDVKKDATIHIAACGTAMHAGLIGKVFIEKYARIRVSVEVASEFRYNNPILGENDIVLLLSQSGETADTLAALRYAKSKNVRTTAVVNVVGSSVAREADDVIYTPAGPEIAVASTKAYSVQAAVLYLLAIKLAYENGRIDEDTAKSLTQALKNDGITAVRKVLVASDKIREIAKKHTGAEHLFFIGRGEDVALCTEGSLKLKEISYIHSEAYPAGELKHGTISLIHDGVPVVAVLTEPDVAEKTVSGMREVKSRGAEVFAVATAKIAAKINLPCDSLFVLPECGDSMPVLPCATVLQLFAYHTAAAKGLDVDKPRNLAKSVTVE